jgi:hypothetical protein
MTHRNSLVRVRVQKKNSINIQDTELALEQKPLLNMALAILDEIESRIQTQSIPAPIPGERWIAPDSSIFNWLHATTEEKTDLEKLYAWFGPMTFTVMDRQVDDPRFRLMRVLEQIKECCPRLLSKLRNEVGAQRYEADDLLMLADCFAVHITRMREQDVSEILSPFNSVR